MALFSRRLVLLALCGLLAACQNAPPPRPAFADLTFAHRGMFTFEASEVEVVNEYIPPLKLPNVEHEMPISPAEAATRWARDRLQATGNPGRTVRAIVKDARVIETDLRVTRGLRGALTADQAYRYDAVLEVVVEVRSARGFQDGFVAAKAARSVTVPEGITINDRERVYFALVESLMQDIDAELDRNIRQYLAQYLR